MTTEERIHKCKVSCRHLENRPEENNKGVMIFSKSQEAIDSIRSDQDITSERTLSMTILFKLNSAVINQENKQTK